jgi:hypothetical protein
VKLLLCESVPQGWRHHRTSRPGQETQGVGKRKRPAFAEGADDTTATRPHQGGRQELEFGKEDYSSGAPSDKGKILSGPTRLYGPKWR